MKLSNLSTAEILAAVKSAMGTPETIKEAWVQEARHAGELADAIQSNNPTINKLAIYRAQLIFVGADEVHAQGLLLPVNQDSVSGFEPSMLYLLNMHTVIDEARNYTLSNKQFAGLTVYSNMGNIQLHEKDRPIVKAAGLSDNYNVLAAYFYGNWDNETIVAERYFAVDFEDNDARSAIKNVVEVFQYKLNTLEGNAATFFAYHPFAGFETLDIPEDERNALIRQGEHEMEPIKVFVNSILSNDPKAARIVLM